MYINRLIYRKCPSINQVRFKLHNNYPNPFNPKTTIKYELASTSQIEISIYNSLGQKMATLVANRKPAGSYQVEWNATGFASGVYYYQLKSDNGFVETKKLTLIK